MKEYLLLFRNAASSDAYLTTTQDMAEDMPKWQAWIGHIAMQGKLVSTAPVEFDGVIVNEQAKAAKPYQEASTVLVSGYLICKADSPAEVEEWSRTCPILKYPQSSVEIRPLIAFPVN